MSPANPASLMPGEENVLTIREAAKELRCSRAHIHNVIRGKVAGLPPLPVVRIGRRMLILRVSLREWLSALEVRGVAENSPIRSWGNQ